MQPNTKMSSGQATFDLKAAREAMARATERPNVTTDIYHLAALTYLPAALDEIDRQANRIAELEADLTTYAIDDLSDERLSNRMANHSCKHNWVNMAPNNHMTCSKCGKVKG